MSGTLHHRSGGVHAAREEFDVETPCRAVIGRQFAPPAKRFRLDLGEAPADQIAAGAGSLLHDGFGKAQAARARRGAPLRFYNFRLTPTPATNPVQRGVGGAFGRSELMPLKIGQKFFRTGSFSRCSPRVGCRKIFGPLAGVCDAFQNSSSDSCGNAGGVHCPQIGGYPSELRFSRLVSELYMPTAGTRSANRSVASRAGFCRSRQRSPVGKRQYGHRVGITKRTAGRYRTSQYSEELWYSVSGQARQPKPGEIPFSEGGFLGEHLDCQRHRKCLHNPRPLPYPKNIGQKSRYSRVRRCC